MWKKRRRVEKEEEEERERERDRERKREREREKSIPRHITPPHLSSPSLETYSGSEWIRSTHLPPDK